MGNIFASMRCVSNTSRHIESGTRNVKKNIYQFSKVIGFIVKDVSRKEHSEIIFVHQVIRKGRKIWLKTYSHGIMQT